MAWRGGTHLDRLKVRERVRDAIVPLVVLLVHRRPELLPPEGQVDRHERVEREAREHDDRERGAEAEEAEAREERNVSKPKPPRTLTEVANVDRLRK